MITNQTDFEKYVSAPERRIVDHLIDEITSRGCFVRVWDGGEFVLHTSTNDKAEITGVMGTTEADTLYIHGPAVDGVRPRLGWIALIWGNDRDLLSDWSDSHAVNEIATAVCNWIDGEEM